MNFQSFCFSGPVYIGVEAPAFWKQRCQIIFPGMVSSGTQDTATMHHGFALLVEVFLEKRGSGERRLEDGWPFL